MQSVYSRRLNVDTVSADPLWVATIVSLFFCLTMRKSPNLRCNGIPLMRMKKWKTILHSDADLAPNSTAALAFLERSALTCF